MEKNELSAAKELAKALDQKFGIDILVMHVGKISTIADYFVIATGSSQLQIHAMAATAEETMARHGFKLNHSEGLRSANWVLLDFGSIILHLFDKENRSFYNLEKIWGDAPIIEQ